MRDECKVCISPGKREILEKLEKFSEKQEGEADPVSFCFSFFSFLTLSQSNNFDERSNFRKVFLRIVLFAGKFLN